MRFVLKSGLVIAFGFVILAVGCDSQQSPKVLSKAEEEAKYKELSKYHQQMQEPQKGGRSKKKKLP